MENQKTPIELFKLFLMSKGTFLTDDDVHTFKAIEKYQFQLAYQNGFNHGANQNPFQDYYDETFDEFETKSEAYLKEYLVSK